MRAPPKTGITTFLILTALLSATVYLFGAWSEAFRGAALVFLPWAPGVAALATMLLLGRNWRELGFRRAKPRYLLGSLGLPVAVATVVYGLAWAAGVAGFDREAFLGQAPLLAFLLTFGLVASTVQALGEELGWQGFLVPALYTRYSFTATALINGLIWSLWHYPSMFLVAYHGEAPRLFEMVAITLQLLAASFILSWLRLRSGSVWPAAIFHGTFNLYVQNVLDPTTIDTGITEYVVGEFGLGLAIAWAIVAYVFWRRRDRLPG